MQMVPRGCDHSNPATIQIQGVLTEAAGLGHCHSPKIALVLLLTALLNHAHAAEFIPLGNTIARLRGVSADGVWVTGARYLPPSEQPHCPPNADCGLATGAFRWSKKAGFEFVGDGEAFFGVGRGGDVQAFRWRDGVGIESLGDLPGGTVRSFATAVSSDGEVIVGLGTSFSNAGGQAFRWTEKTYESET